MSEHRVELRRHRVFVKDSPGRVGARGSAEVVNLGPRTGQLEALVTRFKYGNVVRLKTDPDLDPIRGDPRFQAVLRRLESPGPDPTRP